MHVLFVTPTYPPMPGGGERYAAALAQHLRRRGHCVSVLTSEATQESHLWDGVNGSAPARNMSGDETTDGRTVRLPVRPFPGGRTGLMAYRKGMVLLSALPGDQSGLLARLASRVPWIDGLKTALASFSDIDLVHAFNLSWESAMVAAAAMADSRSVPFVVTPFAHFGEGTQNRVARNSTMDHQLRIQRQAAGVLVLTEVERGGLAAYGVSPDSIEVIGGSADPMPANWAEALIDLRERGLPEQYALFVGRASRDKGALDAAETVSLLRRRNRDIALVLAGSSSPEFDQWLAGASAEEREGIIPLGLVSDETKHALLSQAAFLLLPSRSDSFGIVLLEAWQHARPVIGARAGGIPGVIDDGRNGLLVDYGNPQALAAAMTRLLDDPELADALGADGLRKVTQDLTWERTAALTEAAYRRIVDQG